LIANRGVPMETSITTNGIYGISPIRYVDDIPVFSETNEYVENYEKIASDHLNKMKETGENPFIPEDMWLDMEQSTRELVMKYSNHVDGNRLLDVGVGLGRLLCLLPSSFDKYGMDISMEYLKIAKNKGIEVCNSLIEDMPYKKDAFDMIICTDVLEHVLDLNLACFKMLAVLKKDGIFIGRVPYRENLSPYLSPDYPYRFVHLRNFDEYSVKLIFNRVLGCDFIEYNTVPIAQSSLFKCHSSGPLRIMVEYAISLTKYVNQGMYKCLVRSFYNPCIINFVVRK
jgi:ubiquinone/menaquinone biosynthesis C-methylase UbiE